MVLPEWCDGVAVQPVFSYKPPQHQLRHHQLRTRKLPVHQLLTDLIEGSEGFLSNQRQRLLLVRSERVLIVPDLAVAVAVGFAGGCRSDVSRHLKIGTLVVLLTLAP